MKVMVKLKINERIKLLRSSLGLNQDEFGDGIGLSRSQITNLESGRRDLTDRNIALICSKYHVYEDWLRNEKGPMLEERKENVLDKLKVEYGASALDLQIIAQFFKLSPEKRQVLEEYILSVAEAYARSGNTEQAAQAQIDREVESYRQELEAERLGKTSEVLPDTAADTSDDDGRRHPGA